MKILLCSVPFGSLEQSVQPFFRRDKQTLKVPRLPVALLRILTWIEKKGYSADIYDINNLRPSDEELIKNFKRTKPTVVGLSGIFSQCYIGVKRISKILRELFPDIWIVTGGHLTASSNVVLHKTETDICVVGDGEIPFLKLLDYFKLHPTRRQINYTELGQIKGLAFIDKNNKLKVTGNAEQLSAFDLLHHDIDKLIPGLQEFGGNGELIQEFFDPISIDLLDEINKKRGSDEKSFCKKIDKNTKFVRTFTSRGCVARCTFCQRAQKGYRTYAANDFETHILKLKEKYNVGYFILEDENFGSNRKQSYETARLMKKHDLFWMANGVRCTSVTYEDLKFYKEHNMIFITFGIESGSQKIIDIMEKKFKTEDVYNAISNCKKVGIKTFPDSLMIGMPGETRETIVESAHFIASLRYLLEMDWNIANTHLAIAIPGTPLYEYSQQIGVIGKTLDEEEDYLIRLCEYRSSPILGYLNKTESSIKEVHYWLYLYRYAGKKAYVDLIIKNNKSVKNKLLRVYEKCIKASLDILIKEYSVRKKYYKNKKLSQKMKSHASLLINFLLSLSVVFLPKAVLFPMIRAYANIRFYFLHKINKVKKGKQKHNLFIEHRVDSTNGLRISENRIAKVNRQIDRSLRSFVMDNRKQMKPAITDEEKGLQILAQSQ